MQPNSSSSNSKSYRPPVAPKPIQRLPNQVTPASTSTTLSSLVPSLDALQQLGITICSTPTPRLSPAPSVSSSRPPNTNAAQVHSHSTSPATMVTTSTADLLDLDSIHLRSIEQTLLPLLQQVCYFNYWVFFEWMWLKRNVEVKIIY